MMRSQDHTLQQAKKDFQLLRKSLLIPPQMQIKLAYLLAKVQNIPTTNFTSDILPDHQKNTLDQVNTQSSIHLFINIVNCLADKQIILYFRDENAYIRKDGFFTRWKHVYITCDSNRFYIKKNINEKPFDIMEIINLRTTKYFHLFKSKHTFKFYYCKQKSYYIGFNLQSTCSHIHTLLRQLIKGKIKRQKKINQEKVNQQDLSRLIQPSVSNQEILKIGEKQEEIEEVSDLVQVDQNTDRGAVVQFIRQEQLNGESLYKLLKAQHNIRQLVNKNYVNKLKTQIILPKPKILTSIFDYYLKMDEWNPQIEQCVIKIKLDENSYLIQLRIKKYSYLSWPRCTVILATALTYRKKYFLTLRSTGEDPPYSDTVKMQWNQIIQLSQSQDKVLVSICSEFDFKGYSSLQDSQKMGLKFLDNLHHFEKFYEAKEISTKNIPIFNFPNLVKLPKAKRSISMDVKIDESSRNSQLTINNSPISEKSLTKITNQLQFQSIHYEYDKQQKQYKQQKLQFSDLPNQQKNKQTDSILQFQNNKYQINSFIDYKLKSDIITQINPQHQQKLIDLIRNHTHQRYYLHHKFNQQVQLDLTRNQYSIDGPTHYIYQNKSWKTNEDADLVFINQQILQLQKNIVNMIVKQIGSNIMSGKSIMNMSLPVEICENKSILQRVATGLGYAPKYFTLAAESESLVEQAINVTLFALGISPLHLSLSKPFNPILGETFQCIIGGIPLYLEQISHHPPISALLMKTDKFTFYGAFHTHAQMGINKMSGKNLTPLYIQFPETKTFYEIKLPQMQISGLVYGDKKFRSFGKGFIHERTNNLFIEWSTGKDKKTVYQAEGKAKHNSIYGGVYTVTPKFAKKFRSCQNKQKFDGVKMEDIIETHSKITGHWCFDIYFNGILRKSVNNPLPNKIQYPQYILPSDSNFRLDIIYKRMNYLRQANQQKQILQNIQRRDKKLREGKIKIKGLIYQ